MIDGIITFAAVLAALEVSKYLDGKGKRIRDQIIRIKRSAKRWINSMLR